MIKEIIAQWEENKGVLKEYFKNTKQGDYDSYSDIVKMLFKLVIKKAPSYGVWDNEFLDDGWNIDAMTVIDDGDYQGTQVFLIPIDTYQPSATDYIVTNTYYGSCSGCDTLQAIGNYDYDEKPNEEQVKDYMTLALHLVQKMKMLYGEKEDV
jgi:hypothetical protein